MYLQAQRRVPNSKSLRRHFKFAINLIQYNRYPDRDSDGLPLKYRSRTPLLQLVASASRVRTIC